MKSAGFLIGVNLARNVLDPSHPSSDALREYIVKELQGGLVGVDEDIGIDITQDVIDGIHDAVRFLNSRMMRIPNVTELVAKMQEKINPQRNEIKNEVDLNDEDEDDPDGDEDEDDDDSETESGSVAEVEEGSS